ncbi:MAG: hypothetical protein LBJ46_03955 [Planctomycetota bacterium]|jgi:hypothetical protein|nr:hypothetical protein [Planctomycetota bacterium]
MVIRPMATIIADFPGETGRPVSKLGEKDRPTPSFPTKTDRIELTAKSANPAGLYSFRPLFKIIGAVELTAPEPQSLHGAEIRAAAL